MSNAPRQAVFLVDPIKSRREALLDGLKLRFKVEGFGTPTEALEAFKKNPAQAVVFHIRQVEGNGVSAGSAFRKAAGAEVVILVLGPSDQPVRPDQRQLLVERSRIDQWVPRQLDAPTLEVLLWNELRERMAAKQQRPVTDNSLLTRLKEMAIADLAGLFV